MRAAEFMAELMASGLPRAEALRQTREEMARQKKVEAANRAKHGSGVPGYAR